MTKRLVPYYTFEPSTNTVKVPGNIKAEKLLLITNITDNKPIYIFSDEFLGLESATYNQTTEETEFVLTFNCNTMSATDKLQIFYEKDYVNIEPSETYVDAVSKFRVSNPENLIDTDFEYGPQASKWETLQTINNIPSFYSSSSDTTIPFISTVESLLNSDLITVKCSFEHGLSAGLPITVTGLSSVTAEGTYLIQSVPNVTSFTYKARAKQTISRELQGTYTSIIPGKFFQGSQIGLDEAQGIVSDLYTYYVKVYATEQWTLASTPNEEFRVGASVTSDNGGEGVLTKIDGNNVYLRWSVSQPPSSSANGDSLTVAGVTRTDTTVVGTTNKYYINTSEAEDSGYDADTYVQTQTFSIAKKAIYIFDQSDASNAGHPFRFSETADGTHNSGVEYTTYVYSTGTPGSAGAYTRIYTDYNTPNTLYYYCTNHAGMGGDGTVTTEVRATSKVYLTTTEAHGFADKTNFYFVNTVSPKIFDIPDPTVDATDGIPTVNEVDNFTNNIVPDITKTDPYNIESTYTLRFEESDIDYGNDRITIPGHRLENHYALLYYPNPGDTPINGLSRMSVYYVKKIDDDTIELHDALNNLGGSYKRNLSAGGTFTHGKHNLGLVYNIYREYKRYNQWYTYFYTFNHNFGGTYSGHDMRANSYGLGGQNFDRCVFFSQSRSHAGGNNGSYRYTYNDTWRRFYGTYWVTYGNNLQSLPLGTSQWQGQYDMLTDTSHRGYNGNSHSYGYWVGRSGSPAGIGYPNYWAASFHIDHLDNNGYIRMRGSNYFYWYHQLGHHYTLDRYYSGLNSHGATNAYLMFGKQNTTTNDSIYKLDHLAKTGEDYTLDTTNGDIHYYYDNTANRTQIGNNTTVRMERIDDNRFRIKDTSNNLYRLAGVTGAPRFFGTFTSPYKNTIFVKDHNFADGEYLRYDLVGSTAIGGLTSGTSYYVRVYDNNRFSLLANSTDTNEIDITSRGVGLQSFENTTADFGTTDGSYSTTKAVAEDKLSVSVPFKIPPALKGFDANTAVNTTDHYITMANHYFSTGTRVIYDNQGGTSIGGLNNGQDYYIVVVDNNIFKLADSLANATASSPTTLTFSSFPGSTETHQFISASMSGQVSGTGTVEVVNGSRVVTGTEAAFQRFYKIGDKLRIVNAATTPGVIVEKTITAITDDDTLLVDTAYDFSGSSLNYLIPSYIYVRPDGFFLHRPFDGGMEIGTSKSPNARISRQTRKYFRYQSGKGIQTSFAINFIPQVPVQSIAYTPLGSNQTLATDGNVGDLVLTVADTSNLHINMEITGDPAIPTGTRVLAITNSTTLQISKALTASISGVNLLYHQVKLGTVICTKPHNFESNVQVRVKDCSISGFNTTSDVHEIVNDFEFKYVLSETPTSTIGGGFTTVSIVSWSDCDIRAGMFDDQNGFFFEYNGETLNCVRRSSVQQLPGTISVTNAGQRVTGTDTSFISQLAVKDDIVIRGMTYQVTKVISNTEIIIQPAYRGVTAADVICTKTIDTKVGQDDWNIDHADGNGPSGYILNLDKIQMCYMDYSWYGAGKIRFGFKDQNGHVKYVHEFKHNNRLTESYFRSGNLPARYEVINGDNPTYTGTLFHWGTSVIMDGTFQDDEAYMFTASGNVQKYTNAQAQQASTNANSTIRNYYQGSWYNRTFFILMYFPTSDASKLQINTLIYHPTVAQTYFLEGRPIDSKSRTTGSYREVYIQYFEGTQSIFPYWYTSRINTALGNPAVPSGTQFNIGAADSNDSNLIPDNIPLISIRLAPSVDSSITGSLGEREIINRMSLALDSVGILTTHESEISLILNPQLSTDEFQNVDEPSLCQLVRHGASDRITGGSKILSFRASGAGNGQTSSTNYDLTKLSDLGNSILGGDGVYPNGPDLLCLVANIVDSTGVDTNNPYSISARVTWQESQA